MDYERMSYMFQCLLDYAIKHRVIDGKDFISYCNQFDIQNSRKIWSRDEAAAQSEHHEMHPNGKQATLKLASMAGLEGEMVVLDAGCGHGGAARILAAHYPKMKFIGIDQDYLRVIDAIFRTLKIPLDNLEFQQQDAYGMSFEDNLFDIVFRQHAVYGGDERLFLKECCRILKPNGRIAFQGVLCQKPFKKNQQDMADFSLDEYDDLLAASGFEMLCCETVKATEELLDSVAHGNPGYYQLVKKKILIGIKLVARKR